MCVGSVFAILAFVLVCFDFFGCFRILFVSTSASDCLEWPCPQWPIVCRAPLSVCRVLFVRLPSTTRNSPVHEILFSDYFLAWALSKLSPVDLAELFVLLRPLQKSRIYWFIDWLLSVTRSSMSVLSNLRPHAARGQILCGPRRTTKSTKIIVKDGYKCKVYSVLFTLINHEAVTGTIRMTRLFTHHSSHSQRRTLAGHMTVGEGIQQTCRLGCYLVKARVHSLATVIGQSPNTFISS